MIHLDSLEQEHDALMRTNIPQEKIVQWKVALTKKYNTLSTAYQELIDSALLLASSGNEQYHVVRCASFLEGLLGTEEHPLEEVELGGPIQAQKEGAHAFFAPAPTAPLQDLEQCGARPADLKF